MSQVSRSSCILVAELYRHAALMQAPEVKPAVRRLLNDSAILMREAAESLDRIQSPASEKLDTNTPGGPNRDASAGTSHSEPDGSATKPAIPSSQGGASQGAGPIPSELLEAVRGWVHARAFSSQPDLLRAEWRLNETFRKVVGLSTDLEVVAPTASPYDLNGAKEYPGE